MIQRLLLSAAVVLGLAAGASAQEKGDALAEALALPELFAIMREEGIAYGRDLEADLFTGAGGARWQADVAAIYDTGRIYPLFVQTLGAELRGADTDAMIAYLESEEGARVVHLEIAARRAFLDTSVREAAEARVEAMAAEEDPRLLQIEGFIATADLLEANVANALNGSLAFYRGLSEGGAMPDAVSEEEMLRQVWAQEPDIRDETETWLYSYLATAYAPLDDAALDRYIAFYDTRPGQDLNRALFAAFDRVFTGISHDLGVAAARQLTGQDL